MPHQKEVTQIMAALVQAIHNIVPPEVIAPVLRHVVDNFVHDKARPEVMTVGLKAGACLLPSPGCSRCPPAHSSPALKCPCSHSCAQTSLLLTTGILPSVSYHWYLTTGILPLVSTPSTSYSQHKCGSPMSHGASAMIHNALRARTDAPAAQQGRSDVTSSTDPASQCERCV